MTKQTRRPDTIGAAIAATLFAAACATAPPVTRQECTNPDAQLAAVLQPYEEQRAAGCTAECDRLRREIERLAVVCSRHAPTLMANAVLTYDDGRRAEAQQLLDMILAQPTQGATHADAAALRARIAIEDGNLPYANRLLQQQIKLSPDHAGLHETHGALLYLEGQLANAENELAHALSLGAPPWRIAYHRGLIRETEGRLEEAIRYYVEALAGNPGWRPAQSRLTALRGKPQP